MTTAFSVRDGRSVFSIKLIVTFICTSLISMAFAGAEEIRIACGLAPWENVFKIYKDKYEKQSGHKLVFTVDFEKGGADVTMKELLSGKANLASAGVLWSDWQKIGKDKKVATDSEIDQLVFRVIGRDLFKIIAHPAVKAPILVVEQIEKIFAGEFTNWKQVGGPDLPIVIVLQKTYPATNAAFRKMAMRNREYVANTLTADTVSGMVEKIEKTPGAVGFGSGQLDQKNTVEIKTKEEIGRPITAITKGKPSPAVLDFYDFIAKEQRGK